MKEGLVQKHIRHITLECPSDDICADTVRQITELATQLTATRSRADASGWSDIPMSRSACDGMVPCPWQGVCYRWPQVESPSEIEGFVEIQPATKPTVVCRPQPRAASSREELRCDTLAGTRSPDNVDAARAGD
jgi:hypothetical protein